MNIEEKLKAKLGKFTPADIKKLKADDARKAALTLLMTSGDLYSLLETKNDEIDKLFSFYEAEKAMREAAEGKLDRLERRASKACEKYIKMGDKNRDKFRTILRMKDEIANLTSRSKAFQDVISMAFSLRSK